MKLTKEIPVRIERCDDCSLELPLREAQKGEVPALWECCSCGARYNGVIARESTSSERKHVRRVCRR